jgi:hypothetical protein
VEVLAEEGMFDYDEEKSPKVSLASITCIKQTHEEDVKGLVQGRKTTYNTLYSTSYVKEGYYPQHSQDGKTMILFEAITEKMKPNTLKLKGSLKGKDITILVDLGSTHNFVDINLAKQLNLFVYLVKDLMVTIVDGQPIEGVGRCHKVSIHIQKLELQTDITLYPFVEWTWYWEHNG